MQILVYHELVTKKTITFKILEVFFQSTRKELRAMKGYKDRAKVFTIQDTNQRTARVT